MKIDPDWIEYRYFILLQNLKLDKKNTGSS